MAQDSLLLQLTGKMPLFRILDFLIENKGLDFSKQEIASGAKISRASLFNYWAELEKHGIVKPTRSFGNTTLFTLNSESLVAKRVLDLESALIRNALHSGKRQESPLVH